MDSVVEPALAPVRDAASLLDLDAAERTAWMQLWRKVADSTWPGDPRHPGPSGGAQQ